MWSIRQSPYMYPDQLTRALENLAESLLYYVTFEEELARLSCEEIRVSLLKCFNESETIMKWNEPKLKSRRTGSVSPVFDSISLEDLARNISYSLIIERLIEEDSK